MYKHICIFYQNTVGNSMDASKLTQMRMEAANTYRSHWQPRDASEITSRNMLKAAKDALSTHRGPANACYGSSVVPTTQANPSGGFSTNYTQDALILRAAGCAICNDSSYGLSGGVTLLNCNEVSTILQKADNPVKMAGCCASTEVVQRGYAICCGEDNRVVTTFNFGGTTSISNPVFTTTSQLTFTFINLPGTNVNSLTFTNAGFGFNSKLTSITCNTNAISGLSTSSNSFSFNLGVPLRATDEFTLTLTTTINTFTAITA
jgi:hypothetical protein